MKYSWLILLVLPGLLPGCAIDYPAGASQEPEKKSIYAPRIGSRATGTNDH